MGRIDLVKDEERAKCQGHFHLTSFECKIARDIKNGLPSVAIIAKHDMKRLRYYSACTSIRIASGQYNLQEAVKTLKERGVI